MQRGDRPSQTVRGDCKTGQTHSTWFYNPARQRSLGAAARRSPPCAKGGQTVADGQGGLTAASVVNDTSRRVWASSARCPQSLSRRSPTAPFAQGSCLCCSTYNRPPRVDNKKLPRWGSFLLFTWFYCLARKRSMFAASRRLSSAEAVRCPDSRSSLCLSGHNRQRQRQERVQRHAAGGAGASRPRAHTAGESMAAAARCQDCTIAPSG